MHKLLMLGSSYAAAEMIECAKNMGVYTITTDDMDYERSRAKQVSDEYWMISIKELDILESKCREEGITAVMCGISEFCQDYAMALCDRLGLPNYASKEGWNHNRDKSIYKATCKKVGAPVATDYYLTDALTEEELAAVKLPVAVKPVDQCSNKGLSFCHTKEELIEAYRYARSVSGSGNVLVERMINGTEFLCHYAIADGEVSELGVLSCYVEEGAPSYCYMVNTSANSFFYNFKKKVGEYARKVIKEAGCKDGYVWLQFLHDWDDGNDYFIEMGYRLPGDLVFLPMQQLNGFDSVKWMVECALGIKHTPADLPAPQTAPFKECACAYMLWTNKAGIITEVRGLDEIAKIPGITIIRNSLIVGDEIGQYRPLGNIMFATKDCDEMCQIIDLINQKVSLIDQNGEDILYRYTDFDAIKQQYELGFRQ